jgi:hypothetical protein
MGDPRHNLDLRSILGARMPAKHKQCHKRSENSLSMPQRADRMHLLLTSREAEVPGQLTVNAGLGQSAVQQSGPAKVIT